MRASLTCVLHKELPRFNFLAAFPQSDTTTQEFGPPGYYYQLLAGHESGSVC